MPFARPSLSALRTQVAQDIATALPGSDPLLRYSNLAVLGDAVAGLGHLHYGYLDWISKQAIPFTCTGEFLEAWASLKGVYRLPATQASGTATLTGTNGTLVPSGSSLVRGDGVKYTTTADGTISGGTVTVPATADADPTGLTGAFGNCAAATVLSLGSSIAGVNTAGVAATLFTGGADVETDESLYARMLLAFQTRARGGSAADYVQWASQVAGVTRSWCVPHGYGAGTVLVYFMLDDVNSAYGGFPQGTDGAAADETRATTATGDQLTLADYLFPLQPVTALVYAQAPAADTVDFTISGLSGASTDTKDAVEAAITGVFREYGSVGAAATTVALSLIESAVSAVAGTTGFVITSPAGNITSPAGSLPTLGTTTWA